MNNALSRSASSPSGRRRQARVHQAGDCRPHRCWSSCRDAPRRDHPM